ncbi:MAG: hypothetical protein WC533_02480 [Candidatus Pacearchaeota archaeon]
MPQIEQSERDLFGSCGSCELPDVAYCLPKDVKVVECSPDWNGEWILRSSLTRARRVYLIIEIMANQVKQFCSRKQ